MVYRYMYAAYADEAETFADIGGDCVITVTLSRFRDMLFLYYETHEKDLAPEQVISGKTRPFPDGRHWFFMPDIFHYSRPMSTGSAESPENGRRPASTVCAAKKWEVIFFITTNCRKNTPACVTNTA